jgi:hypothetical protein
VREAGALADDVAPGHELRRPLLFTADPLGRIDHHDRRVVRVGLGMPSVLNSKSATAAARPRSAQCPIRAACAAGNGLRAAGRPSGWLVSSGGRAHPARSVGNDARTASSTSTANGFALPEHSERDLFVARLVCWQGTCQAPLISSHSSGCDLALFPHTGSVRLAGRGKSRLNLGIWALTPLMATVNSARSIDTDMPPP